MALSVENAGENPKNEKKLGNRRFFVLEIDFFFFFKVWFDFSLLWFWFDLVILIWSQSNRSKTKKKKPKKQKSWEIGDFSCWRLIFFVCFFKSLVWFKFTLILIWSGYSYLILFDPSRTDHRLRKKKTPKKPKKAGKSAIFRVGLMFFCFFVF